MNTSDHVQLMDTTLRDGEQTRDVSFSTSEKVSIAKALLGSLRVDRIEVASAAVSAGEKEAVTQIAKWAASEGCLDRVEILGFVDERHSADWILATGGRVLNLHATPRHPHAHHRPGDEQQHDQQGTDTHGVILRTRGAAALGAERGVARRVAAGQTRTTASAQAAPQRKRRDEEQPHDRGEEERPDKLSTSQRR